MKSISWDAYWIFLVVARKGGLTGAAQETGLSPATIGRRILQLEQAAGLVLFSRRQNGYTLTTDGALLFEELRDMEAAVRRVETWRQQSSGLVTVRVAAGTWGARLIADNFKAICTERDQIRVDLVIGERRAQLAHRENDIGLRSVEPSEPNLAARLISDVAYAAYQVRNAEDHVADRWIAIDEDQALSAYLRFPHEHHAGRIVATVDRARSLLDLVTAGVGVAVLPCFVGDLEPALERTGDEISALRHGQWIVTNADDRSRREIRLISDRIFKLFKNHSDVFAGKRPSRLT